MHRGPGGVGTLDVSHAGAGRDPAPEEFRVRAGPLIGVEDHERA